MKYDNITKAQARGWIWNQIESRIPKAKYIRENYRVFVLIGDTLEERNAAVKRKFSPFNVIGVDERINPVLAWRKAGGIAVQGPIDLVVQSSKIKPNIVICDYCGGITKRNFQTFWSCYMNMKAPGAIGINLLRGRDDIKIVREEYSVQEVCSILGLNPINRAHVIYSKMIYDSFFYEPTIRFSFDTILDFERAIKLRLRPAFYTYKSIDGGNYFDSMVISLPASSEFTDIKKLDNMPIQTNINKLKKVRRRMAALEAVRTTSIKNNKGRMYAIDLQI